MSVTTVALGPGGRRAVSGSSEGTVRVWDIETGTLLHTLEGHTDTVFYVAVCPDGRRAVTASRHGTVRVWDIVTGELLHSLTHEWNYGVRAVAVSPNGRWAVSARRESGVTAVPWAREPREGAVATALRVWDRAVSAINTALASAWRDSIFNACVWDIEAGSLLHSLEGQTFGDTTAVAVSPDGRRAVLGSKDGTVRVRDIETDKLLHTLEGHWSKVTSVTMTPEGRWAVSTSHDGTICVWDLEAGGLLHTLEGLGAGVVTVALSPDGRRAVSGLDGYDLEEPAVRVWDIETGTLLHSLKGHEAGVTSVAVMPDGRWAVTASRDNTVRVWDIDSGRESARYRTYVAPECLAVGRVAVVTGDENGLVHLMRLEGVECGPLVVTATEAPAAQFTIGGSTKDALAVRCPLCRAELAIEVSQLGSVISCTSCDVDVRLNPFVVHQFGSVWGTVSQSLAGWIQRLLGRR